jgi:hypothetical protein
MSQWERGRIIARPGNLTALGLELPYIKRWAKKCQAVYY